ncbi:MAG: DUF975 family protein [Acetatifactor sp.]|nr:DUF975 family protein [Acetatifactor sp.]
MKTPAKCVLLKNTAKTVMAGKYYFSIMTLIFAGMVTLLFNRFTTNLNTRVCQELMKLLGLKANSTVIIAASYVLPFFLSIVLNVLQIGLCLFFLKLVTNQPLYTFEILYGYYHDFGKSFRLSFVLTLLSFVCFLPTDILMDFRNSKLPISTELLLGLAAAQILLLLIFFPISLALSQVYYIMLDYPDISASEILKLSMKIMNGKKKQLFYIQLSFLPLFFAGVLSFGIGLFWVIPYRSATMALYYLDVMKPSQTTNS